MPLLDHIPSGGRILVLRLRSLGDCVLTTPALRLLKQDRPDCEIAVVVEPRFRDLFTGNPDVAWILAPELKPVIRFRAHLSLNLHGGTRSMWLTVASLARHRAGFGHHSGSRWAYNAPIPRAQEILGEERVVHTAEHLASAMFFLGVPPAEIPRARLFAPKPVAGAKPYAVIHAMASQADKTWPGARFAEIGRRIAAEMHLEPVFIGADSDDLSSFTAFRTVRGAPLKQVQTLLSGASLFVGNDSGPAHMAAAYGLPVVVLFGSSDPVVWAPWKTAAEVVTAPESLAAVSVDRVWSALEKLKVRA